MSATPITATYRLQLTDKFTLDQARELIPYFQKLGISHFYTSPIQQSRSDHGYDITEHSHVKTEIGGDEAFRSFAQAAKAAGLGIILDIVPNHMGIIGNQNHVYNKVLAFGPRSQWAQFFDIDWLGYTSLPPENRVLIPILGEHLGQVVAKGEIQLVFAPEEKGVFYPLYVDYYDNWYPLKPESYATVLEAASNLRPSGAYSDLISRFQALAKCDQENYEVQSIQLIADLQSKLAQNPDWAEAISQAVATINQQPEQLLKLLDQQYYRLASWRIAAYDINYRRFFDIDALIGLQVELPIVFDAAHQLIERFHQEGLIDGVRIDHIDGLKDPTAYLTQLRQRFGPDFYITVEKILEHDEVLPEFWPIQGTSGYDYLSTLNQVLVDEEQGEAFRAGYQAWLNEPVLDFAELVYTSKHKIMHFSLPGDIARLSAQAYRISRSEHYDFSEAVLRDCLREIIACFPVYRTYIDAGNAEQISEIDRARLQGAVAEAKQRRVDIPASTWDYVENLLLQPTTPERLTLIQRFQQVTGPVMAKGKEDTAFYNYNLLISLNEVGCEPAHFGWPVADFHAANQQRQSHFPYSMLSSSTHDTKRSEDARARLHVLSEIPETWYYHLGQWHQLNQKHPLAIHPNDELLIYQTLLAIWPIQGRSGLDETLIQRVNTPGQGISKALREAKARTSWTNPNAEYEAQVQQFTQAILHDEEFINAFDLFATQIAGYGALNSLAQVVLKIFSPGVPDFYQGSETLLFQIVDPDNRVPVKYGPLQTMLAEVESLNSVALPAHDPRLKLLVTQRALTYRRQYPELLTIGAYQPLEIATKHLVAFARSHERQLALVLAPRFLSQQTDQHWEQTQLKLPPQLEGTYHHLFTGEQIDFRGDLAALFSRFPVAVLVREA
ncbi:malto-oligosyltrehalose synthase [Leptolyngbya sp. FACHB-261]|uniref:malto-oligosyltrehalose synthase n=1 Tax=Leptolyngbya sp. FACHB-261 TaxID=2692806 RepID=UPI001682ABC2|nr:malto-oligosyltrehalose synthase [Leptolyngbya sp. FACHB-261]MBD2102451.1 malto-oligosyltrehalose synthase [Leptolyngbya sp. FACHB-261]